MSLVSLIFFFVILLILGVVGVVIEIKRIGAQKKNVEDFVNKADELNRTISNQRIKLSASSAFYLKMAARFALLFASLQVDSMLYPRLMFSDNMEDKGMEETRAKNFQRMIVQRLKEMPSQEYQLIFATSNIADELNTPEYTIGEYYTQSNKSLKSVN